MERGKQRKEELCDIMRRRKKCNFLLRRNFLRKLAYLSPLLSTSWKSSVKTEIGFSNLVLIQQRKWKINVSRISEHRLQFLSSFFSNRRMKVLKVISVTLVIVYLVDLGDLCIDIGEWFRTRKHKTHETLPINGNTNKNIYLQKSLKHSHENLSIHFPIQKCFFIV